VTLRSALILSAAIAGCASPAPAADDAPAEIGPRYISIGVDALDTARAVAAAHGETLDVIDADADVAVVVFDAASFGALSEQLHERFSSLRRLRAARVDRRCARPPPCARPRGRHARPRRDRARRAAGARSGAAPRDDSRVVDEAESPLPVTDRRRGLDLACGALAQLLDQAPRSPSSCSITATRRSR
jgi:hypothetical protein